MGRKVSLAGRKNKAWFTMCGSLSLRAGEVRVVL